MSIPNRSRGSLYTTIALLTVSLVAAPAANALTVYTDRAAFEAAAGPLLGEGFETPFSAASSVDFGPFTASIGFGAVVSTNATNHPQFVSEGTRSIYGFDGSQPSSIGNTMRFTFDSSIHAFGVDINGFSAPFLNVQGTGSDRLLITPLWNTVNDGPAPPTIFFGVVDPEPFHEVAIFWNNNQYATGFDDLTWSPVVPEPSTGSLTLLGLGLLAGSRRRPRS